MFIGYFNLANTVTMLGLASSIMAVFCASQGDYVLSITMLLFAGLCDMFDGRIARSLTGRLRREKVYGIQIDSLADVVSFGVVPALIVFNMNYRGVIDLILYLVFIICGAIRLAYFNTQALLDTKDLNMKFYTGLPIPFSCVALPPLVLLTTFFEPTVTMWIFRGFFLFVGIAFVLKIRIKKIGIKPSLIIMVFDLACLITFALREAPKLFT